VGEKPVEQYDMLRSLHEFLQWRAGDSIILAEANVLPETDMEYFGEDGDRMHMMFNFQVNQNLFYALLLLGQAAEIQLVVIAQKQTPLRCRGPRFRGFERSHQRPAVRGCQRVK
jgi:maltose alpha-D-glucosyltransferase / alpha-amylase